MRPPRVLTVAGSDSGGGAGIEADLKTFERLGVFGMAAVTAVTAQNTLGVHGVWTLPPEAISRQIAAVADDIGLDAVKTGMLGTRPIVEAVAEALVRDAGGARLVVDPVLVAKGGERLLDEDALQAVKGRLVPLAAVLTPNIPEAEALTGIRIADRDGQEAAARALVAMGAGFVVVKGGHGDGPVVEDVWADGRASGSVRHPRIAGPKWHGTGCTFSAAMGAGLARHLAPVAALELAAAYVEAAIRETPGHGRGYGLLGHHGGQPPWTSP